MCSRDRAVLIDFQSYEGKENDIWGGILIQYLKKVEIGMGLECHISLPFFGMLQVPCCQVHDGSGSVSHDDFS